MTQLGISPDGSNIKQYGDFWSALSSAIKNAKSTSSSSSSATMSVAAPSSSLSTSSAAAIIPKTSVSFNSLTPTQRKELENKGVSPENYNELGGGARRRKRKTKKARKTRRTRRNNKK